MTLWRLVIQEIRYRKGNFALAVVSVLVAAGCLVAAVTLLRAHDVRTGQIIEAKIAETEAKVRLRRLQADKRAAELNEAFRTIMLKFGYNMLILPDQESMTDYRLRGGSSKYMDERSVRILSESGIMTVRHLLPVLQQRQILIFGDERQEVFLIGTRGEIPLAHREPKKPLLAAVGPGKMIVGYDVHRELGLNVGDKVKVLERQFEIIRVYDARGDKDDSSVWIDLKQAQQLLGKAGKINGILALSCICTRAELDKIIEEVRRILPGTQVRVKESAAVIRYESRVRAAGEAKAQVRLAREHGLADIQRETRARAKLKGQMEAFTAWVVPLIVLASAVWMGLLAFGNVRQRGAEIGILCAIGLRSRQIFTVFLARALLTGLAGALIGCAVGFLVASAWPEAPAPAEIFDPLLLVGVLLLAPVLSGLASWAPAMIAARQDPAVVLSKE